MCYRILMQYCEIYFSVSMNQIKFTLHSLWLQIKQEAVGDARSLYNGFFSDHGSHSSHHPALRPQVNTECSQSGQRPAMNKTAIIQLIQVWTEMKCFFKYFMWTNIGPDSPGGHLTVNVWAAVWTVKLWLLITEDIFAQETITAFQLWCGFDNMQ